MDYHIYNDDRFKLSLFARISLIHITPPSKFDEEIV